MVQTVGIFSRSGEEDYAWLRVGLQEHCNVLPVTITNNNQSAVRQSIHQCQFGILYHTKNRGRINITDVTDSLYDDEIRQLSDYLGKKQVIAVIDELQDSSEEAKKRILNSHRREQVIAVIDDLEDSSEEAKERILNSQPTLRDRTQDIFLFTTAEKQDRRILREKIQLIIVLIPRGTFENTEHTDQPNTPRASERDEDIPMKTVKCLVVMVLSAITIREAYRSPNNRKWILAGLWTVEFIGTFYKMPLESLWSNRRIHSMLPWTMTLVSLYNTYCRPSAGNAGLSALWLLECLSLPHSHRRQSGYKQWAFKAMGCGLVLYSFYKGWQMRNATNVPELVVHAVLSSPIIMTAV